ncbi:nuclease homologue [Nitratireductor aquibiodomus]|uniref:Nuclease homologue n=1 Tax=Nitratireductor aquibiodomus TaxID=204799 RepID=A0A1H4K9T7_9HYPH|nr:thermonuclease family protein [Nitratireductor aquibiodomus]SEB55187.1 nuclease homologue [Nitratireductor aquibiodomus]
MLHFFHKAFVALLLAGALSAQPAAFAARREVISGPVEARVLRVIDGDTFVAEAHVWPGQRIRVSVRIRGVDAPELRSRCAAEKAAARAARAALGRLLAQGTVRIGNISGGKYYGRVLADVTTEPGGDVASRLLDARLVAAYGGGRRASFVC